MVCVLMLEEVCACLTIDSVTMTRAKRHLVSSKFMLLVHIS